MGYVHCQMSYNRVNWRQLIVELAILTAAGVAYIRGAYRAFAYGGIHGCDAVIAYQLSSNNRVVEQMARLFKISDFKPFHESFVIKLFQVS